MRLFVTGGTGFVGSHFVRLAINSGHTVVSQRRPGSIPRIGLDNQPTWIDQSLDGDFRSALEKCDAFIHFAAHTPNPPYDSIDRCIYWNVFASCKLVQQAALVGIKKFLIAGTCFEYGSAANGQDFVHPGSDCRPVTSYPISKAAATVSFLGLARDLGLQMRIMRIFQVFGEGEAPNRFWPSLRIAAQGGQDFAMTSGTQIRDFINVEDVATKFLYSLDFSSVELGKPQITNVGTGRAQTLLEFATFWWSHWRATGRLMPGEIGLRQGELNRLVADTQSIAIR